MMEIKSRFNTPSEKGTAQGGFTLVELMIAMVVAVIMGGAMVANYISQQRSATVVRQVAQMQQQLRGAFYILEHDIRIAGFNPQQVRDVFGITDVRRRSLADGTLDSEGRPSLSVAFDWAPGNPPPNTSGNGALDAGESSLYYLRDNGMGLSELVRDLGGDPQLVAENIEAIDFAFGFIDNDGELVRDDDGIVWAIDTNNDNRLDARIDADGNPDPLGEVVTLDRIRAVRIQILARAQVESPRFISEEFVVAGQTYGAADGFRRRLMERVIDVRNAGT